MKPDPQLTSFNAKPRLYQLGAVFTLGYLSIAGRLAYLQGFRGASIREQAVASRTVTIPLEAHRGELLDCQGRPLAISIYSGIACFDPSIAYVRDALVRRKILMRLARDIPKAAALLGINQEDLQNSIQKYIESYPLNKQRYIPLKYGLSPDQANALRESHLVGFGVHDSSDRQYSLGADAAQVIGFLGSAVTANSCKTVQIGEAGLERGCNSWLTGHSGKAVAEVDNRHHEIAGSLHSLILPQNGLNVHLTLDSDAQHIASQEAATVWNQFHPHSVAVVVVDPRSGDIKALVSLPNYNANPQQALHFKRPPISLNQLHERTVCSIYEPGSTVKPLLISGSLNAGLITTDTTFVCRGSFQLGRKIIHCAHGEVHGVVNPAKILQVSCNIGAAHIGLLIGGRELHKIYDNYGLFDRPDLPIPGVERGFWSLDKTAVRYSPAKTARASFGQAVTTTPLALTMAYSTLANNGLRMQPRLISCLTDGAGRTVKSWMPQPVEQVVAPEIAKEVRQMLCNVVTAGTGRAAAVPGYWVAGKTGTASLYKPGEYVGSFMGMLPAGPHSIPRAVILVVVNDPEPQHYYGAEVAAPAFKAIAAKLMALWNIPQDDPNCSQARAAGQLPALPQTAMLTVSHTH